MDCADGFAAGTIHKISSLGAAGYPLGAVPQAPTLGSDTYPSGMIIYAHVSNIVVAQAEQQQSKEKKT